MIEPGQRYRSVRYGYLYEVIGRKEGYPYEEKKGWIVKSLNRGPGNNGWEMESNLLNYEIYRLEPLSEEQEFASLVNRMYEIFYE